MWLFTVYGFFSVVCARNEKGKPDASKIMVRARNKQHLLSLQKRFGFLLGTMDIEESQDTDYPFRLFVGKPTWVRLLGDLAKEINYDNFKAECSNNALVSDEYLDILHKVWGVAKKLDPVRTKKGKK